MNERDERIEELAEHMVKTQGIDKEAAKKIATEMFEYRPAGPSWFSKSLKKTVSVSPMIIGAMGVAIVGLSVALVTTNISKDRKEYLVGSVGTVTTTLPDVPPNNAFNFKISDAVPPAGMFNYEAIPVPSPVPEQSNTIVVSPSEKMEGDTTVTYHIEDNKEGRVYSFETPEGGKEGVVYSFETPEGNVYSYETPPVLKFKIESNKLLPNSSTPPITTAPNTGTKSSSDEPPTITINPKTGTKAK
ncbi:MAG TPA: hypothetical protein PLC49_03210 [Caldisericia bacterium]|nr:hypothetical protein [Caldisericia bacterium]